LKLQGRESLASALKVTLILLLVVIPFVEGLEVVGEACNLEGANLPIPVSPTIGVPEKPVAAQKAL